jgi:putative oxidoreductase
MKPQSQTKLGEGFMSAKGALSSALSSVDRCAAASSDILLLLGRILIALLFLLTAWFGSPNAGYLTFLGYPYPAALSALAVVTEFLVVISLVFGIATRLGALLGIAFVVLASVTAHRYWTYPEAQQQVQWIFLTKNFAALGGLLLVFAFGSGRFGADAMLQDRT